MQNKWGGRRRRLAPYMWREYAHGTHAWIGHRDHENLDDALKGILYEDDSMCLPQVMDFGVDKQNPRVEIELEVKSS
jgi:crossover junction endodeoxyribonuclease RusA